MDNKVDVRWHKVILSASCSRPQNCFVKATAPISKHHIALFLKGSENTEMCFNGSAWHDGQKLLLEVKDSFVVGRYPECHVPQKWWTSSWEVPEHDEYPWKIHKWGLLNVVTVHWSLSRNLQLFEEPFLTCSCFLWSCLKTNTFRQSLETIKEVFLLLSRMVRTHVSKQRCASLSFLLRLQLLL